MDDRTLEALRGLYDEHGKPLPIRSLAEVLEERCPMKLTPERLDELERLARLHIKQGVKTTLESNGLLDLISMARASVWRPIDEAPTNKFVPVWGYGRSRFMKKDANGQWRNGYGAPREAPKVWFDLPTPQEQPEDA